MLFFYFTDPRKPRGSLSGWEKFCFRPAPGSPRMITRTYITQRNSTVIRLLYHTFCCTASTPVMFNTPVFFLWAFIKRLKQLHCTWYSTSYKCCSRDYILIFPKAPQAHVASVMCYVHFLTRVSVSRYKRPLRLFMRNQILRSANAKYHFISTFFL